MSNTCFAGMRKVTSHSERNSIILASRLGRMFWAALKAGSRSGTCAAVGTPAVRLAYSSAKKSRHILETHWLGFSMSIVILARGHGSGSVDRQCNKSDVSSGAITGNILLNPIMRPWGWVAACLMVMSCHSQWLLMYWPAGLHATLPFLAFSWFVVFGLFLACFVWWLLLFLFVFGWFF